MKEVVKNNPDSYSKNNVCGRVKVIEYKPGVNLKGSWEVKVAKWLDNQNIVWETEVNPQPYFWQGSWHLYFPDFYLCDLDIYLEVKGYKTDRDEVKWSYFNNDLLIIDKQYVNILENMTVLELSEQCKYSAG